MGARVIATVLKAATLDGRVGTVVEGTASAGRFPVPFDGESKTKAIKGVNLEKEDVVMVDEVGGG